MRIDRRRFVNQSVLVAGALILNAPLNVVGEGLAASPDGELWNHMSWMNEPASSKIIGNEIMVRSRAKTVSFRQGCVTRFS
jgi:hypothetical protein